MNLEFENEIIASITQIYNFEKSFEDIVKEFDNKFLSLDLLKNSFELGKYFSNGKGLAFARNKMIKDGKVREEWMREYQTKDGKTKYDFKGLYVFINKDKPFYVGISKGVIGRILQHVKGHSHNNSTLAYNISLINYEFKTGEKYKGTREELNFKQEVAPIKEFLLKQKVAWINIDNDEELYLFEIYCAMNLGTVLNKFETH